jgi:N-methylhydantoinase B
MGGGTSRVVMNPGASAEKEVQAFSDDNIWSKGDLVRIYTAGGGGWGDPLERETHLVNDDVQDGYVTLEAALRDYGVVIDPITLATDEQGTESQREEIRTSRGPTKMFHRFNYFNTADEEYEWINEHFPR